MYIPCNHLYNFELETYKIVSSPTLCSKIAMCTNLLMEKHYICCLTIHTVKVMIILTYFASVLVFLMLLALECYQTLNFCA